MPPLAVSMLFAAVLAVAPRRAAAMTVAMEVTDAGALQDASSDGALRAVQPTTQTTTPMRLHLPETQRRYSNTWSGVCRYDQSMLMQSVTATTAATACHSWSPSMLLKQEWLQIDVPKNLNVRGVVIQGVITPDQGLVLGYSTWVKQFRVEYNSANGNGKPTWDPINKNFSVNFNATNATANASVLFDKPVSTQSIRLIPTAWQGERIQMRAGVLLCDNTACSSHTVFNPNETSRLYSSIFRDIFSKCAESNFSSVTGWCTDAPVPNQWMQLDLLSPQTVQGIALRGATLREWKLWVKQFRVNASNDGKLWTAIEAAPKKYDFVGNIDEDNIVERSFSVPQKAKHFRIIPTDVNNYIGLRVALLVSRETGNAGQGRNNRNGPTSITTCSELKGTQCFNETGGCIMLIRTLGQTCQDYCELYGWSCIAASDTSLDRGCGSDPPPVGRLCKSPAMDAICWCNINKDAFPTRNSGKNGKDTESQSAQKKTS